MRNRSMLLPAAVILALCGLFAHDAFADSDVNKAKVSEVSSGVDTSKADLQEIERAIKDAEDKLLKREYEQKAIAGRSKMHAAEMKKCGILRDEIFKLRDSISAFVKEVQKLRGDAKKAEEVLTERSRASRALAEKIKTATDGMNARDNQFKEMSAAVQAENDARRVKIGSLKEEMKIVDEKMAELQANKTKIDNELNSQDAEYKAEMNKLNALKSKLSSAKKDDPALNDEIAKSKNKLEDFVAKAREWEESRQKLMDDILAATAVNKTKEEAIASLGNENALKEKALKEYSAALDKEQKDAALNIKKLQKEALDAKSKQASAEAALKKAEDNTKSALEKQRAAERELNTKTEDLKLRISTLVGKLEQDGMLKEIDEKAAAKKSLSKGARLSADVKDMFDNMKNENDRLIAENKTVKAEIERVQADLTEARRNAEEAAKEPEELRVKLDKERLDMHYNLAIVYEKNGLYEDAEREYLKCLKINPKDPGVHYNLGILYDDKLNKNSQAMDHYWAFLTYRPMGETAERVRDWITKLELEKRLGKEMR